MCVEAKDEQCFIKTLSAVVISPSVGSALRPRSTCRVERHPHSVEPTRAPPRTSSQATRSSGVHLCARRRFAQLRVARTGRTCALASARPSMPPRAQHAVAGI
eukprot:6194373-Pleurochrysis_carterae.AAC.2